MVNPDSFRPVISVEFPSALEALEKRLLPGDEPELTVTDDGHLVEENGPLFWNEEEQEWLDMDPYPRPFND